jgi:hypothetical protein
VLLNSLLFISVGFKIDFSKNCDCGPENSLLDLLLQAGIYCLPQPANFKIATLNFYWVFINEANHLFRIHKFLLGRQ